VAVDVRSDDPLTGAAVAAYLKARHGTRIRVTQPEASHRSADADILLVLVSEVGEEVLAWMRRCEQTVVLVADEIDDTQLLRAVGFGLASILPRRHATPTDIAAAVLDAGAGRPELPHEQVAALLRHIRDSQRGGDNLAAPDTVRGLSHRDRDVLRCVAYGLDTSEIAAKMNYSERTIKNVIQTLLERFGTRNRAHAVGHAYRSGIL
jgi:DNA-binding NarL/FixJ family response regulator